LFLLPTLRPHANERIGGAIWPGIVTLTYVVLLAISFMIGQGGGQSVSGIAGRPGVEWPLWLIGGLALVVIGYILLFTLLKKNGPPTRMLLQLQGVAMTLIAMMILAVIFFTQSRGPWIGGMAGLFVFFTVLLALAWRRTRIAGSPQANLWRNLLIGEVVLALALGGFLVAFNLSHAPFFEQLRTVPYIGRMGKLLEVDEGTGKVRRLIWVGDEQAGGSVALIKSDAIRAIVGWGPESMFVAYNRFYPPSLANIESRGASPDRSHEAYLDELINKGVLGLASYLFVLISFFALARRLILRSEDWSSQVLLTACIAVVTAHLVEGFTGIPIVATLMLLWIAIAITVIVGKLNGEYSLNAAPVVDAAVVVPEPTPEPEPRAGSGRQNSQRRQSNRARGSGNTSGRGPAPTRPAASSNAAAWLVYGLIALGTLAAVWSFNLDNVYADMRFQQGQTYTEDPQADLDRYIIGTAYYLDSVRMEPDQDFYYLSLGRSLMSIVDIRRQTGNVALGQPNPQVRIEDLLRLQEPTDVQAFVLQQSPMTLMSYAEAILNRAQSINPLNKDHFANLARMYNFWYSRLQRDPAILAKAVDWYKRGVEIAPQDVTILNEYASAIALQGNDARSRGDQATADARLAEAAQLLARSQQIDPLYRDTPVRIAEVLRLQGNYTAAVDSYVALLAQNPRALDNQISTIIDSLRSQPALLLKLRSAYDSAIQRKPDDVGSIALVGLISARTGDLPRAAQAFTDVVRLQPDNLEARQNYTLVLSDMLQYRLAASEAEVLLRLAKQQGATQQEQGALESLLGFMRQKAAGQ
jgi:tetratricopeptide (TPR) repeat protein